jgi:site-specific recombinase XerC
MHSQSNSDPEDSPAELLPPSRALVAAPVGATPDRVRAWFDHAVEASEPVTDGTLASERAAADTYRRMAKAENTRRAYRAAVRAWCAWCAQHDLPPLPASGADVAAFLAGERGRQLLPETLKLRRAAIRYLHRAAGCPVPTDDVCVSETMAGISREAAKQGVVPRKKVAATTTILRRLLEPIPEDLRGIRDRAVLLVGFAGALRRSELAAICFEHMEKTDRGIRLTLPQTKGEQTNAVTVPLPYGDTELCPVRALERWQQAANLTEGAVFRRIWLSSRQTVASPGESPAPAPQPGPSAAAPRIGKDAITPQTVAQIIQTRAMAAGFDRRDLGGHSLKRGALTTGMDRGVHPAKLKRLGRHKSFDVLGEYLEFGDLFDGHPLNGVL